MEIPEKWSIWKHNKTGQTYSVIIVANVDATKAGWNTTVVYQSESGKVWASSLDEWTDKYTKLIA